MPDKKEKFNEEVMEVQAESATLETDGVACMSMLPSDIIQENILRKNPSRGIKISKGGDGYVIDVFVVVRFGCRIPETAWNIQENVKKRVQESTGAQVNKVNIHIEGVKPNGEN